MKFVQKTLAGAALAGLVMAQPIIAQAATPRAPAPTEAREQLHGGSSVFLVLGIFAALLLLAEVTDLIDVFGNDEPTSP